MTFIYYLTWFSVGFMLGPFITFNVFVPVVRVSTRSSTVISIPPSFSMRSAPFRDMPIPVAVALGGVAIIGWLLVQSNAMWRRRVTIDTDRKQIELFERIFRQRTEVIPLSEVESFGVSEKRVRKSSKGIPDYLTMFRAEVHLKTASRICLMRSVDRDVALTLADWGNRCLSQTAK